MVSLLTLVYLATIPVSVMQRRRELRRGETHEPGESVLPEDELLQAGLDHGAAAGTALSAHRSSGWDERYAAQATLAELTAAPCFIRTTDMVTTNNHTNNTTQ